MSDWIAIHDSEWTAETLTAVLTERAARTTVEHGPITLLFPTFGYRSDYPTPEGRPFNPGLYHHLKLANAVPPPDTEPLLASSPATQVPLLGRLWQTVRGQFHAAILFYVNRAARRQTQLDNHLISTLNELTRTVAAQQAEIEALRAEVRRLQEKS